jgi:type VI secretion system protein VasG
MRSEPKSLVKKLTPSATRALETAAGKAVGAQHFAVEVDHVLLAMLEGDGGDVQAVLRHFGLNQGRALTEIERTVAGLRSGHTGRPVISENVFRWLEDTWLMSSLELGEIKVRSGALLLQLALDPGRYGVELPVPLDELPAAALRSDFANITGASSETAEAMPAWDRAPAGPRGAAGGPAPDGALARFTTDFTEAARAGRTDPIFGRHREIRQMVDILSRRRKNNPIIVGEPGVGKTALVEGLALAIVAGEVPEHLLGVRLLGLDLGALQAGASVKGEFENRLRGVISEIQASPIPIILFIDEAHMLIGAGGAQGTADAANLLKPALARGELRTVAATTWAEYKKYFEKDAALERRFQAVKVDEPAEQDAIVMLRGLKETYEKAHGVVIRDEAIEASVRLSHRYITGRQLPDKAVDLLDTTAARVRVQRIAKPEALVHAELSLAALERERTALERDAADGADVATRVEALQQELAAQRGALSELDARWTAQRTLLDRALAARTAVLDASRKDSTPEAELAALRNAARAAGQEVEALDPDARMVGLDVDAEAVAGTVASWTGIPVGRMRKDSIDAVLRLEDTLRARIIGQEPGISTVAQTLRVAHAKIRDPNTPVGVLLFVGPSGVGKTETALTVAEELYGGEQFMTTINMSEFQEKHSVSRLVGSPPGYVGYGEGGVLTEAVRQRPHSVVLLDECEKADLDVMNLFYQVFDKGTLNDGEGRRVDFRNTVVILTSNLATDLLMDCYADGAQPSPEAVVDHIRPTLSRHFKPALLARMTIVPFAPISVEAMISIAQLKLSKLKARVERAHGLRVELGDGLLETLAARCTAAETGARNLDHILRGSLMPELARALLLHMSDESSASRVRISLDSSTGSWDIAVS